MILNLTQHKASEQQIEAGVVEMPEGMAKVVRDFLTFEEIPSKDELVSRASFIVTVVETWMKEAGVRRMDFSVMVGGAPFFMEILCVRFRKSYIHPVFAFSKRESVEEVQEDGSVVKRAVFKHLGFVDAFNFSKI